jgi:GTP-binding protein
MRVDTNLATLMDLRYKKRHIAKNGQPGGGNNCSGGDAAHVVIRVPLGTQVYRVAEDGTSTLVIDLDDAEKDFVLAEGGIGGRGNARFATASRRSPEYSQPGRPGDEGDYRLELKLLADVGLVGFPNAGKSTLVSRISRARPKIADYPFTTLKPNLGVVRVDTERSYVVADIPGLIEGAAEGAGLGIRFLKHIERTKLFLFLVTQDYEPGRGPVEDFHALRNELGKYDASLLERPYIVVLSQTDRPDVADQLGDVQAALDAHGTVFPLSSVTGSGLPQLLKVIADTLAARGRWGGPVED